VAAELSGLNLIDLGVNSINMDYSDLTNQLYFQSLFVQKFVGSRNRIQRFELNLHTIQTSLSKKAYGSVFGYLKYDLLIISIFN
jgi:NTE family protein